MDNNELQHYGIPGMKWGVRKDVYENTSRAASNASNALRTASSSTKKNKKASELSDEELKKVVARMELEQKYSNLNPSSVSKGSARAADILSIVGGIAAVGASVAQIAVAIKSSRGTSSTT